MRLKTLHPFLIRTAVTLVLAVMTATAWGTTYTVTLKAGEGSGSDVTLNSENDYYGTSLNGGDVPKGKFFTMNSQLWFKCPDCPFSARSGEVFAGWSLDGSAYYSLGPGGYYQISGDLTLTACWATAGDAKLLTITPSAGTLDPNFSLDVNDYYLYFISGSSVEATVTAVPRDPNASVTYNGSNSCPTLHDGENVTIDVTNGDNMERYIVDVCAVYSITMTTEGEGTAKAYLSGFDNSEQYTGQAGDWFTLKATPAEGWRFKEWQLVSGGGTLDRATQQNNGKYTFPDADANPDNVVLKAVFEETVKKVSTWTALKTAAEAATTEAPVSIELEGDITRNADEAITVTGKVTLDLNGKKIDGNNKNSYIFAVGTGGDLTITDLSDDKDGEISGAHGSANIYIRETGKVTLAAGTIGGTIVGVSINMSGSFTMNGGTINTGNSITGFGVELLNNSSFTMNGGTITGNNTGVNIASSSATMTVSGNVNISGNTSWEVILIWDGSLNSVGGFTPIHIGGKLSPSARIGVYTDLDADAVNGKVFTSGLKLNEETPNGSASNFFVSGRSDLAIVANGNELGFAKGTTLTVNDAGGSQNYWCSYYNSEKNMRVNSQGVTVYKAKLNAAKTGVELTEVFSNTDDYGVIGARNAVLIHSKNGDVINLTETDDGANGDYTGNKLQGTDSNADQEPGLYHYVISKPDASSDFGFYKLEDGVELGAHKAYLIVDSSIFSSGSRGFLGIGDETTSLTPIPSPTGEGSGAWYSLDGRKLQGEPTRKGVYVRDGKKFIIK